MGKMQSNQEDAVPKLASDGVLFSGPYILQSKPIIVKKWSPPAAKKQDPKPAQKENVQQFKAKENKIQKWVDKPKGNGQQVQSKPRQGDGEVAGQGVASTAQNVSTGWKTMTGKGMYKNASPIIHAPGATIYTNAYHILQQTGVHDENSSVGCELGQCSYVKEPGITPPNPIQ
ncbi:hypothetical protein K7X08_036014 [Anisodus acutangulus]|uniref:Uncharacterized protein n=1 Tax=Anisodus acutangulus TaxID=402998 RepID=A0A9Q1QVI0_9SOLA|nr:hypothetical protein K7X08_036014 [Anisodus acutangulus]